MAFNFSPKVVTDGLVLALDAANPKSYVSGSTVWRDLSSNNRNGTLINNTSYSSQNGGVMVFDGVNDYVDFPGVNFGKITSFTICAFVKPIIGDGSTGTIANNTNNSSPYGWHCRVNTNGVVFWVGDSSGFVTEYNGNGLTTNVWNFFAVSVSPTTITHYKNGIANLSYNGNYTYFSTNGAPFKIGVYENLGFDYSGNISSFTYYNRTLSAQEILQNYNATKGRFGLT
jgi:hypothetical protein